ncbi:MAG: DNA repair protein RadC [Planctomycetota bacterium]
MSKDREQRISDVLNPLYGLDQFTGEDAKRTCLLAKPSYVTKTISQLVKEGVLDQYQVGKETLYRWKAKDRFDVRQWIDQQVHGIQITEQPEHDRPRERLLKSGAATLSTADLLAILIRVGVRNESAITAAQKLFNRFQGRLPDLIQGSQADLKQISPAITKASYATIMAGIELGRRIAEAQQDAPEQVVKITSTAEAIAYCQSQFARLALDAVQEEFHIVTLDTKHKPIRCHKITVGTLDASLVHPREVFRPAIADSASAILLVHNHPSGDPRPSREDVAVTKRLSDSGKLLGLTVLDHIVVAKNGCTSIREEG